MFGAKRPKGSTKDLVHGSSPEPDIAPESGKKTKEKKTKPPKERHGTGTGRILRSKPLWGAVCVIAGLLIAFVAAPKAQEQAAALTQVVVLTADAPVGTQLTGDMLTVKEMGVGGVPKGAVTDLAEAIGKYMAVTGLADDILTAVRLSAQYPTTEPALLALPEGKVAMAVALDSQEQSVASKLRSGDVIQLFAVLKDDLDAADNTVALGIPELRAVEVLSVTNSVAVNITDQDGILDSDEDRQIATVVLAVDQQQAAKLAGLTANAHLHAALVSRGDEVRKTALLEAQAEYMETLLHPESEEETGDEGEDPDQEGDEEDHETDSQLG